MNFNIKFTILMILFYMFGWLSFIIWNDHIRKPKVIEKKVVIKQVEYEEVKTKRLIMSIVSDYYNNEVSKPFRAAVKLTEMRERVIDVINAVNRFKPQILGDVYPFDELDILAIIDIESRWNPRAVSPKHAKGLMQILDTKTYIKRIDGVKDPFDINCSVYGGLSVLKDKYNVHKDKKKAIIAYNGVVKNEKGEWSEIYWVKFKKARAMLEEYVMKENK